jgi:uncharacterized transporter YbjL
MQEPDSVRETDALPAERPPPRNASILQVVPAVFWSFVGVRKGKAMQKDVVNIRPHQVILVGIFLAAMFVVTLLVVVRMIIRAAGA